MGKLANGLTAWFEAGMIIGMLRMLPDKEREIARYAVMGKIYELEKLEKQKEKKQNFE